MKELYADKDYRLIALMRLTVDAMAKAEEKEVKKYGVSRLEAAVLFITRSIGDSATPAEIARWMFREHHSVSHLLKRMKTKGLIELNKDLAWKNMIRVSVTEEGERAYRAATRSRARNRIGAVLTKEERRILTSCLKKLREVALKELSIDYKPPFP